MAFINILHTYMLDEQNYVERASWNINFYLGHQRLKAEFVAEQTRRNMDLYIQLARFQCLTSPWTCNSVHQI